MKIVKEALEDVFKPVNMAKEFKAKFGYPLDKDLKYFIDDLTAPEIRNLGDYDLTLGNEDGKEFLRGSASGIYAFLSTIYISDAVEKGFKINIAKPTV